MNFQVKLCLLHPVACWFQVSSHHYSSFFFKLWYFIRFLWFLLIKHLWTEWINVHRAGKFIHAGAFDFSSLIVFLPQQTAFILGNTKSGTENCEKIAVENGGTRWKNSISYPQTLQNGLYVGVRVNCQKPQGWIFGRSGKFVDGSFSVQTDHRYPLLRPGVQVQREYFQRHKQGKWKK